MNHQTLLERLSIYEAWQQMRLRVAQTSVPLPDFAICNGQIQFASLEPPPGRLIPKELPVVVGIGINYGQKDECFFDFEPHLGQTVNGPKVDDKPGSTMRRAFDLTLTEYEKNPDAWKQRKLASQSLPTQVIPPDRAYLLVATNFCPHLTFKRWQESNYLPSLRADVLANLPAQFRHLDDLADIVGDEAIWVGHGTLSEVPVLFRLWQTHRGINRWLLTHNLSGQGMVNIPRLSYGKLPPARPLDRNVVLNPNSDQ